MEAPFHMKRTAAEADEARQQLMLGAAGNSNSEFMKGIYALLRSCDANDRRAKSLSKHVTIPFSLRESEVGELEEQFGVSIRLRGLHNRAALTARVSAMVHCLDSMLLEIAGGGGRKVLLVDGDLATVAAVGLEDRLVERSHASARLAWGYFAEDEAVRRAAVAREEGRPGAASVLARELLAGGGEHYWPSVRAEGPPVDAVVFNHFKTPAALGQIAWLSGKRGGCAYGCFPFQLDMLHADSGVLACFPGWFYVDRVNDVITLVPDEDATLSISHPYSALVELVRSSSVVVGGAMYLCEKFLTIRGVLFYTLRAVGEEYERPEALCTSFYDTEAARTVTITYPKAKLSTEGVLVGWTRGTVRMLASRYERTAARCKTSLEDVVHPSLVFQALTDYNNVVVNSLDTAVLAERMSVEDEEEAALAIALHINYARHQMRGTFNSLLAALKKRRSMNERSVSAFAWVALSAWWSRPRVDRLSREDALPVQRVVDWCGNDFGVCVEPTEPWIDFEGVTNSCGEWSGTWYDHLPRPTRGAGGAWLQRVLEAAGVAAMQRGVRKAPGGEQRLVRALKCGVFPRVPEVTTAVVVGESGKFVPDPVMQLTELKERLVGKLAKEQWAANVRPVVREVFSLEQVNTSELPWVPVPDVDPRVAVAADLDEIRGGLVERAVVSTGQRISEVDVSVNVEGSVSVNDSKRSVAGRRLVRLPFVDAGVEGARSPSAMAVFAAVKKRNVGIPANRGWVDLDTFPQVVVQRFIDVCFRDDWQEVLQRHLETGLWEFNVPDIEQYMESLDERKVRNLMEGYFRESDVDLSRWLLITKGKVKSSREPDAEQRVDHPQTIMYLEESTVNAAYSAMTKRFKKCLDEMLRPNVVINSQMPLEEHEEWYNSLNGDRASRGTTYSYGVDAKAYDRSQDAVGHKAEACFLRRMGLDADRLRIWSEVHGPKKALSLMYGVVFVMNKGGVSGIWNTILRNGLTMAFATVYSTGVKRTDLVCLDVKGDDVDLETAAPIPVGDSVDMLCMAFNFSAKFFTQDVRIFCKRFRIKLFGRWVFPVDPWAFMQSVCTPLTVGNNEDTLAERHKSIVAELGHYRNGLIVEEVARVAQQYYGLPIAPHGLARSLSKFESDRASYFAFWQPPQWVE